MKVLIAATTVLMVHARTNSGLILFHGMNKNNVAKHAENEKLKMLSMMIMLMIIKKKITFFCKFICSIAQISPERICSSEDFTSENKRSSKGRKNNKSKRKKPQIQKRKG